MGPRLPDLPSDLIRVALADLRQIEKRPEYVVDMDIWHESRLHTCAVCFAGAVMALELGIGVNTNMEASDFNDDIAPKLEALEEFRAGEVDVGLEYLGRQTNPPIKVDITPYEKSPTQFKADMHDLANKLADLGL